MKIIGIIPARYGSTRFPGKPLAMIKGKTLIQRTFENAASCPHLDEVLVVTDSDQIYQHVLGFGGKALMTPSNCSSGTERIAYAIKANNELSIYTGVINIQGDEPLLEPKVIESVIQKLCEDESTVASTAVVKITSPEEAFNPSVVKCVLDKQGNALYFSRALIPCGHNQLWNPDIPTYKHIGIYGFKREFLLRYATFEPTPLQKTEDLEQLKILENGYQIKAAIVESQSVGVDRPEDIPLVEQLT